MNINGYLDYINTPWGRLFYRLVWYNLNFKDKKFWISEAGSVLPQTTWQNVTM